VKVKNDHAASLEEYLGKKNLKVSDEKMRLSEVLNTLNVVMSVFVVVGTAFMAFSLLIVVLNFSLIVARAKEEVSLLLQLGYRGRHLTRHLSGYLLIFMIVVSIAAVVVFAIGNNVLQNFLASHGLEVGRGVAPEVILSGVGCVLGSIAVSYFFIHRMIGNR
jgi:ABC-type antimicrobial peptide transport system permease subunit